MKPSETSQTPTPLDFDDEAGSSRSKWTAGILGLALTGWMGSGYILPAPSEEANEPVPVFQAVPVAVRNSKAQKVSRIFTAEGHAEPDRRAVLRTEVSGEAAILTAKKGDYLAQGDVIARLDTREQNARLKQAREEKARARREFNNAQTLLERGVSTTDRVTNARAALASSEAQLAQAEEAADAAVIRAPFAGRLDAFDLDQGSFVSAGVEIGAVLDTDPLRIVIQVPQQSWSRIKEGQKAAVKFITGEERAGTIEYVSKDAETETRTFRAEIAVPNPGGEIASGLSARVQIPTGQIAAHFVSPAILSLGPNGELGVKAVNNEKKVVFHEVVLERAQTDGVWIRGLPEQVQLITIGQGFVSSGETVAPNVEEEPLSSVDVDVSKAPVRRSADERPH